MTHIAYMSSARIAYFMKALRTRDVDVSSKSSVFIFTYWLCWAFVVVRRGYSLVAVNGLLIVVTSLVAEHMLWALGLSVVQAHGLESSGTWA